MFNVKTYNPLPKNRARVDKREWLTKKYVKFTPPWVKAQEVIKDFPLEIPNMTINTFCIIHCIILQTNGPLKISACFGMRGSPRRYDDMTLSL